MTIAFQELPTNRTSASFGQVSLNFLMPTVNLFILPSTPLTAIFDEYGDAIATSGVPGTRVRVSRGAT